MLFNSHTFILLFLPFAAAVCYALSRSRPAYCIPFLFAASMLFYGYWNPVYLLLMAASMAVNFRLGAAVRNAGGRRRSAWLWLGIALNLGLLFYFKHFAFFLHNVQGLWGGSHVASIVLPLGISFFTFTQIAYLVDSYRGVITSNPGFASYGLFVGYFPHLIAGPILRFQEVAPQFSLPGAFRPDAQRIAVGLTLFALGLLKKVAIADNIASYSTPVFQMVERGSGVTFAEAWIGALAYTMQIYFDFSAYSDMAVGISWLFGVRLPVNFHSPYKARSIIDFWRCWHMSLSSFLRDYLYVPLGGNRKGPVRRYANLLLTMLIGGIWHGAGWTFLVWGALHGVYLVINHAWRNAARRLPSGGAGLGPAYWLLTFIAVVIAWVFFRCETVGGALTMLRAMSGVDGFGADSDWLAANLPAAAAWLLAALSICLLLPNTQQMLGKFAPGVLPYPHPTACPPALQWAPRPGWALVVAAVFVYSVLNIHGLSEFLYFQF